VLPDPLPLLARSVAVVTRGPYPVDAESGDGAQLVGGERFGRCQIKGRGSWVFEHRGQGRELVGQRLAGRGAGGHDDVAPGVRVARGLGLVAPRRRDPALGERLAEPVGHPARPGHGLAVAGGHPLDVGDGVRAQSAEEVSRLGDGRHAMHSRTGVRKTQTGERAET
jgi:hypothetical protein